jgi:hypothetical protein
VYLLGTTGPSLRYNRYITNRAGENYDYSNRYNRCCLPIRHHYCAGQVLRSAFIAAYVAAGYTSTDLVVLLQTSEVEKFYCVVRPDLESTKNLGQPLTAYAQLSWDHWYEAISAYQQRGLVQFCF